MTETQVAPWDGPTPGTKDTGISRIGVASLAIGNGTAGDTTGFLQTGLFFIDSIYSSGTGFGTFSQSGVLSIQPTFTATSGNQWAAYYAAVCNPSGNTSC